MSPTIKDTKKFFKKSKCNTGFTIIELLVSVFIISLISGIFLANYRAGDQRAKLINAAQKLASDIRLSQSYTLGLREFDSSFPAGGWGIRFETGNSDYIIFADTDEEYDYDAGENYAIIDLPKNIIISNITTAGIDVPSANIVFTPPDPITYINTINNVSVVIALKDNQTNLTKIIKVNFLGMIDVVN